MENKTIYFPTTENYEKTDEVDFIKPAKALCKLLLGFVKSEKVIDLSSELKIDLRKNLSEVVELGLIKEMLPNVYCSMCHHYSVIYLTLSCSHGFCESCLQVHKRQVEGTNAGQSDFFLKISKSKCPYCQKPIEEAALSKIWENYQNLKDYMACQNRAKAAQETKKFICGVCHKIRGSAMLIPNSCFHMCMICVAINYHKDSNFQCHNCSYKYDIAALSKQKYKCQKCLKDFYLFGDRMQEICPNHVYCGICTSEIIDSGTCYACERTLEINEKVLLSDEIIGNCAACEVDIFLIKMRKYRCCKKYICYDCQKSSENCASCGQKLSARDLNWIQSALGKT